MDPDPGLPNGRLVLYVHVRVMKCVRIADVVSRSGDSRRQVPRAQHGCVHRVLRASPVLLQLRRERDYLRTCFIPIA